jgi:DNA polymerase-4
LPGKLGRLLRDRACGIDPRGLEPASEPVSISVEETFDRDLSDREQLHHELRTMASELARRLQGSGHTARTVTTKVRYTDFSIRSRSLTLRIPIDDAGTIAELACALLDRALWARPGALRLAGVGVSGLSGFRQLALDDTV